MKEAEQPGKWLVFQRHLNFCHVEQVHESDQVYAAGLYPLLKQVFLSCQEDREKTPTPAELQGKGQKKEGHNQEHLHEKNLLTRIVEPKVRATYE